MNEEQEFRQLVKPGEDAWRELLTNPDWNRWKTVGETIMEVRKLAMQRSRSSQPLGRGYNEAFSSLMAKCTFKDIHAVDRAALLECIENIGPIETWRGGLKPHDRMHWNYPRTVLEHWRELLPPVTSDDLAVGSAPMAELRKRATLAKQQQARAASRPEARLTPLRRSAVKRPVKRPRGVGVLVHALKQAGLNDTTEALEALAQAEGVWLKDVNLAEPDDRFEAWRLLREANHVVAWLRSVIIDTAARNGEQLDKRLREMEGEPDEDEDEDDS